MKGLKRHLKDTHRLRAKKEQQLILDQYSLLVLLPPKEVRQPPHNCAPFEALGKPLDGWYCSSSGCGHILVNYKSIRGHCNKEYS